MKNRLRIIAGDWRSRVVSFPDVPDLRPTPARVRETLFNWLRNDILGARCLDLYSGSGALGFEAASRGAASVVLVDHNPSVCAALQQTIDRLHAEQVTIEQADVLSFLSQRSREGFDVVFVDPPFRRKLIPSCCQCLEQNGWLNPGAKIYIESEQGQNAIGAPDHWSLLGSQKAGDVGYRIYQHSGTE